MEAARGAFVRSFLVTFFLLAFRLHLPFNEIITFLAVFLSLVRRENGFPGALDEQRADAYASRLESSAKANIIIHNFTMIAVGIEAIACPFESRIAAMLNQGRAAKWGSSLISQSERRRDEETERSADWPRGSGQQQLITMK